MAVVRHQDEGGEGRLNPYVCNIFEHQCILSRANTKASSLVVTSVRNKKKDSLSGCKIPKLVVL